MVMKKDKKQSVELIQRFFIKSVSGFVFFDKAKYNNDEIVQLDF